MFTYRSKEDALFGIHNMFSYRNTNVKLNNDILHHERHMICAKKKNNDKRDQRSHKVSKHKLLMQN